MPSCFCLFNALLDIEDKDTIKTEGEDSPT